MRDYINFRFAILFGVTAIVGCQQPAVAPTAAVPGAVANNTHIMAVTSNMDVELMAEPGDWLIWEGKDTKPFWVHFIGDGPCGSKKDVPSDANGVAKCQVKAQAGSTGPVHFEYYIDNKPTSTESPAIGPQSCGGCKLQQGKSNSSQSTSTSSSGSTLSPSNVPTGGSSKVKLHSDDETVYMYCSPDNKTLIVNGPFNPKQSIQWEGNPNIGDWKVIFPWPQTGSLCSDGKTNFSNSGSDTCNLSTTPVPPSKFQVTTTKCVTSSQTFPVPAPPQ
ncbi:hypothetical protein [Tunturiibacter lichenicola]|uniref:hypothetical protein n=1 Tax=Tunturiibacter lichenicola TaxID=2051959 RepID=UPI0021B2BD45|nr:hypothetical protein [Edaphobacter lichenicola]